jgi:predicted CopG family antitoxin
MAKETKIIDNTNSDIIIEVIGKKDGYVELIMTSHGNPISAMLDDSDIDALIDELMYARGPRHRMFYTQEKINN